MTHYWIQTWQGLCVYYITRHQAHLSFITYISPPTKGEKGERESYPQPLTEGVSHSRLGRYLVVVSPSFLSSFSLLPSHRSLLWEPVKYNNTGVHPGTHKTILPAGILREILETHRWGHPTLLSSHTNGTVLVDLSSMELCETVQHRNDPTGLQAAYWSYG